MKIYFYIGLINMKYKIEVTDNTSTGIAFAGSCKKLAESILKSVTKQGLKAKLIINKESNKND